MGDIVGSDEAAQSLEVDIIDQLKNENKKYDKDTTTNPKIDKEVISKLINDDVDDENNTQQSSEDQETKEVDDSIDLL